MKRTLLAGLAFLVVPGWGGAALAQTPSAPTMTREKFEQAKRIYFHRCAGRHGVFRKGATGPTLRPATCGQMRAGSRTIVMR